MIFIISVFAVFFLTAFLLFVSGMKRLSKPILSPEVTDTRISIVIAAKNEEQNIEKLFSALENQTYPKEFFEIIFVDDESTDKTFGIASNFAEHMSNLRVITSKGKKFPAKKGALEIGIAAARFPNLLITDADCQPQKAWLSTFAKKFQSDADLIFGVAPFKFGESLSNHFFCFENFRLMILTLTAAEFHVPYSAASRSLGITKETFNRVGGFSKTLETLGGDDDLLIREVAAQHGKITAVAEEESSVFSYAPATFKEYFQQKRRHTATSFHYSTKQKLLLGGWHLLNILSVDALFFIPFYHNAGLIFITKIFFDLLLTFLYQKKFSYSFGFGEVIFYQVLYECMLVLNFFSAKFFKIKWKETA